MDKLFQRFNNGFDKLTKGYTECTFQIRHKDNGNFRATISCLSVLRGLHPNFTRRIYPNGGSGNGLCKCNNPQGATVERTEKVLDEVTEIAKKIEG